MIVITRGNPNEKETFCDNCSARLKYTAADVHLCPYSNYDGTFYYIICPCCGRKSDVGFQVEGTWFVEP